SGFGGEGGGWGNKLVRSSSAVCNATTLWFGPRGSSSTIVCRSSERPDVASAIHTSMPLREGSIRTAATACAARALASIDPFGARTMTSKPNELISALMRATNGSPGASASSRTMRRESAADWVCAIEWADDRLLAATAASASQGLNWDDPFRRSCADQFTEKGYLAPRPRRGLVGNDAGIAARSCGRPSCRRIDGAPPAGGRMRHP